MPETCIRLQELARSIRIETIKMLHSARSSHAGSCLSIADILAVLYGEVMAYDPRRPDSPNRDRFILSKGHAAAALYATLALRGFFAISALEEYAKTGNMLMPHASHAVPGVEFSTGALGHGLPLGVGKALAAKRLGGTWRCFVLLGDGELAEGSNWEAIGMASHHQLDNLTIIIDYNRLQGLGSPASILGIEPICTRLKAFGCDVIEVDGHDIEALCIALLKPGHGPRCVVAHTVKGKGVSFMEDKLDWHYKSPNDEQFIRALEELGVNHA